MQKAMSRYITKMDSCAEDKSHEDKSADQGLTNSIRDDSTGPEQDSETAELDFPNKYFQRSPLRHRLKLKVKTLVILMIDRL